MNIQNLSSYDPFADTGDDRGASTGVTQPEEVEKKKALQDRYIHIRIQQRNGRKTLTTLQGLPKGEWQCPFAI